MTTSSLMHRLLAVVLGLTLIASTGASAGSPEPAKKTDDDNVSSGPGQEAAAPSSSLASPLSQAEAYFKALGAVFVAGSSEHDIAALMALMHQDVRYQHVDYGADFDKSSWRDAFMRNWKRGAYNADPNQRIRIEQSIVGKTAVAIAYVYGVLADGVWQPTSEPHFALIEVQDGKILLVKEYW